MADDAFGVPDKETPELTDQFFDSAAVGKYYFEKMRNANVVRIADDLRDAFPNEKAVNDALYSLVALRRVLQVTPSPVNADENKPKSQSNV